MAKCPNAGAIGSTFLVAIFILYFCVLFWLIIWVSTWMKPSAVFVGVMFVAKLSTDG